MRLDQELVKRGLCESRTEAQELIEGGNVLVNGFVVTKQTKQVEDKDEVIVNARRKFVSRGGEKLEGVFMDVFGDSSSVSDFCEAKIALDIGSSTGGFTDFLLTHGVTHVDAVDVGTDQLHNKIKNDERVSVFEKTDIRDFKSNKKYDIVVADLSFISLNNLFENIINFGKSGTHYFLLIKPQFEVGQGNTKKGIVKDELMVKKVLSVYQSLAEKFGLVDVKIFPCRIKGGDGNQEFFLFGIKK